MAASINVWQYLISQGTELIWIGKSKMDYFVLPVWLLGPNSPVLKEKIPTWTRERGDRIPEVAQQLLGSLLNAVLRYQLIKSIRNFVNAKTNYHRFIPVTVHRPHRLISLRLCPKILGNLARLDSVDRKFCSTSRVTKCSANFLTTSSYCTVLASESHTKHKLKIRKLRGYFSSEMRTGYPVGGKIKSQNDSTLYTYFPSNLLSCAQVHSR